MSDSCPHPAGVEASSQYVIEITSGLDRGFWACLLDVTEPELMHALSLIQPGLHAVQKYLQWRP